MSLIHTVVSYVSSSEFLYDLTVFAGTARDAWRETTCMVLGTFGVLAFGFYLDWSMTKEGRRLDA